MYLTESDSGRSCLVFTSSQEFVQIQDCRVTGNNGPVHHTSQQSLICFVIHGEPESTRLRLDAPVLPHPQHTQKQRKSEHPHNRGCGCVKSGGVCPHFLLNCACFVTVSRLSRTCPTSSPVRGCCKESTPSSKTRYPN